MPDEKSRFTFCSTCKEVLGADHAAQPHIGHKISKAIVVGQHGLRDIWLYCNGKVGFGSNCRLFPFDPDLRFGEGGSGSRQ